MKIKRLLIIVFTPLLLLFSCNSSTNETDKVEELLGTNTKWISDDGMIVFYVEGTDRAGKGKIFVKEEYEPFLWTYASGKMNVTIGKNSFLTSFSISPIKNSSFQVEKEELFISANAPYADSAYGYWRTRLWKDKISYFDK